MTKEDTTTFESMKRHCCQLNSVPHTDVNNKTPVKSGCVTNSESLDMTIVSDVTLSPNHNGMIISINYSSGNSAMVLETLIGAQDLNEARERNNWNKEKDSDASNKYKAANVVLAKYYFNEYGCKIGKTALQKKLEIQQDQQRKLLQARKKEEQNYYEDRKSVV